MDVKPRLLIVDDDEDIRDALSTYMRRFDFDVEAVRDGKEMRQRLDQQTFSLVVLDVMLPGENGLSLCKYAAAERGLPVILLTAMAEQADRVIGLEIGADDYVVKPFDPRELVARIRSVLRRAAMKEDKTLTGADVADCRAYRFNGWSFNVGARELRNPSREDVPISTAEFHLLKALVENANRVLSRGQLLDLTQRSDAISFDRSIDSQISRLRKKLEADPKRPNLLKTVRGDGYMLSTRVSRAEQ